MRPIPKQDRDFWISSAAMVGSFLLSVVCGAYGIIHQDTHTLTQAVILGWLAMGALVIAISSVNAKE